MTIESFTPWSALAGGCLIGLSTVLVLLLNGKVAGISGIVARLLQPVPGDSAWRALFLAGMVAGGGLTFALWPATAGFGQQLGWLSMLAAGFLVGFGTRLGGGCTSGHGVCGLARGSLRSAVATAVFMAVGFAVVFAARHLLGAGEGA